MLLPGIDDDVLLAPQDSAVSIYLPIDSTITDERAHVDRLQELFRTAEDSLRNRHIDRRHADATLQPGRQVAAQLDFRGGRPAAIAIFSSPSFARAFGLPISVEPEVVVGHRFYIKPLLPLINDGVSFFVLALNGSRGRLLECSDGGWIDRTPPWLQSPPDIAEETSFQPTAAGNPASGRRRVAANAVGSHSYEAPNELRKAEVIEYLRRVSASIEHALKDDHRPVVLIADAALGGHFRKLTGLRQLTAEAVALNPNGLSNDRLLTEARAVRFSPAQSAPSDIIDRVEARTGSRDGAVATRVTDVVAAAHHGRIDAAVVATDAAVWGRFDDATGQVAVHPRPGSDDDELLNEIVAETLRKGGRAYALARQDMPGHSPAVAALRY